MRTVLASPWSWQTGLSPTSVLLPVPQPHARRSAAQSGDEAVVGGPPSRVIVSRRKRAIAAPLERPEAGFRSNVLKPGSARTS
jgi:hypothetical protein